MPGFTSLERKETQDRVIQAGNTIGYALSDLESKVNDWAVWDDTYFFVQNQSSNFVENNLMDSVFINFRINLFVVADLRTLPQLVIAISAGMAEK
jgi:sensor domain CHASE-containing protein